MASLFRPVSISTKFARAFSSSNARLDLNKVQLIGRVGADPTVTEFSEDRRVVNYTVATSETRPDKEGNLIKRTQWHRITSWNSADWLPEKVKKGDLVYVEGSLRYNDYTDREGVMRTKAEIHQSQFRLLGRPSREE
ncbi:hypothetical protein BDA99DRAFT_554096 [Phascolomyces articulosus]|uniref:Nucleic acid-binding protein n=1 Tax=Phascolomyces articulosus TaxID=60185 RepID=A0AAD5KZ62_9FUNG|nr:hypothetical protein BDA99DRAFT_554096 [Phascolomyces articulosus]